MALAVASTSTVTTNNANNLTLPKASGVEVGDLLLIIASGYLENGSTVSGFTTILEQTVDPFGDTTERSCSVSLLSRIADASDVAASSYTVAKSGDDSLGNACMLRVTGWTAGEPLYDSAKAASASVSGGTVVLGQSGLSLSRPSSSLLIMAQTLNNTDGATNIFAVDGYQITSSGSNPVWTEVIDAEASVNGNTDTATNHLSVAYANDSDTSAITAYQATVTESTSDTAGAAFFLAVICEPADAAGTNALLEVEPEFFSEAAVEVGATGTNELLEVAPEFPTNAGHASSKVWTTTPKS